MYNIGGGAFFVIGYGVFSLFYGVASWPWWLAKITGDITGWLANYLIQRWLVFRVESQTQTERRILAKFSIISVANVPLDYAIVGGLKLVGVSPFLGLWLSSLFFTVWKYVWYKHWVFRSKHSTKK